MDIKSYYSEVVYKLPMVTTTEALNLLDPLKHIKELNPIRNAAILNSLSDGGAEYMRAVGNSLNWELAQEGFSPIKPLLKVAGGILEKVVAGVASVGVLQVLLDDKLRAAAIAELNRMRHPSQFIEGKITLDHGKSFPIATEQVTLDQINELTTIHLHYLKALSNVVSGSRFFADTLPDINLTKWLESFKSLGGEHKQDSFVSDIIYGNIRLSIGIHNNTITSKLVKVPISPTPTSVKVPRPLALAKHIKDSKDILEQIWATDSDLSKSLSDVYSIIDKSTGQTGKGMRMALNRAYSTILGAALELAITYNKACDTLAGKYVPDLKGINHE